jgi:hypothetical protein
MGNSFTFSKHTEVEDKLKGVDFFRHLRQRYVDYFMERIRELGLKIQIEELNLEDLESDKITWRQYSKILGDIKDKIEHDEEHEKRDIWHPATLGYVMREGLEQPFEEIEIYSDDEDVDFIPDGFTDDSASDTDEDSDADEENQDVDNAPKQEEKEGKGKKGKKGKKDKGGDNKTEEKDVDTVEPVSKVIPNDNTAITKGGDSDDEIEGKAPGPTKRENNWVTPHHEDGAKHGGRAAAESKKARPGSRSGPRRKKWDPSLRSPIFFTYHDTTVNDILREKEQARSITAEAEQRAIERAKGARAEVLEAADKVAQKQEQNRTAKIEDIDRRYKAASARREDELKQNQKSLEGRAWDIFKKTWDSEYKAAEEAYQQEVGQLKYTNHVKTKEEQSNIMKRRQEMEAFKDAEAQEMPAAGRLEEIARIEISRWIEDLSSCTESLEEARGEYQEMRDEYEFILEKGAGLSGAQQKRNEKQLREMRAVVNHAESTVRERQKALQDALEGLEDAEALFDRAIRIRKQQDEMLPLFQVLTREEFPSECRVDLFICSLAVLMNGSFEEKWNLTLKIFDVYGELYFSSVFLTKLLVLYQEAMFRLHIVPFGPKEVEVANTVERMFRDLKLVPGYDPASDKLTGYEMRQVLLMVAGKSEMICSVLHLQGLDHKPGPVMTIFQRNKMSCIATLLRGMTSPGNAMYRLHYEQTRYWSQRVPKSKQAIHEQAMAMGFDDPLKPDYSRFMEKVTKKYRATVPPLDHGHLHYKEYLNERELHETATKFQSIFRAHQDRAEAEMAAKRKAFDDAKEMAIKELKAKIMREFKKREATTGMQKIKWDAQVRMKQAKMKAAGQDTNRANTVMLMMEEIISKGVLDIDLRFQALRKGEEFEVSDEQKAKGEQLMSEVNAWRREYKVDDEFLGRYGLHPRMAKASKDNMEAAGEDKRLAELEAVGADEEVGIGEDGQPIEKEKKEEADFDPEAEQELESNEDKNSPFPEEEGKLVSHAAVDYDRLWAIAKGSTVLDDTGRGESSLEMKLRKVLMNPDPWTDELFYRLRAVDSAMTVFKVQGLMAELPSKQLLLRYLEENDENTVAADLKTNFRFTRSFLPLARALYQLVTSDFERGLLYRDVVGKQDLFESILRNSVRDRLSKQVNDLETLLNRKLAANDALNEQSVLELELSRSSKLHERFHDEGVAIMENIYSQRKELRRLMYSVKETERKVNISKALRDRRTGLKRTEEDPEVQIETRHSWVWRLKSAMASKEATHDDREKKYAEIKCICQEFIDVAQADAMVVITEHFQEKYRQTLPIVAEHTVHGRPEMCGRGTDGGKYYTYELHNIEYYVCDDYNGVFNGSQEVAQKVAGKERLGALEYLKAHVKNLNIALTMTVDWGGFRCLAVSKLPVKHVIFNEEGEIRRIFEDRVHGLTPDGNKFVNGNRRCDAALRMVGMQMNLAPHNIRGMKDVNVTESSASSEIQVYRSEDDEFYARNFWHAFPAEDPVGTPHLPRTPRDQSVFWRQLRPEFCRNFDVGIHKTSGLSPDALLYITNKVAGAEVQDAAARDATKHLVDTIIPGLCDNLVRRTYGLPLSEGLGLDLTEELHCRGINMRHLGLLRSLLWRDLPGTLTIFFGEQKIRTSVDLRLEVRHGDIVRVEGTDYVILETEKRKIKADSLPLEEIFMGLSKRSMHGRSGRIKLDQHSEELRAVLLAEMIVRTVKNLIRLQLRSYARKVKSVSRQFIYGVTVEYLNIVTGAHRSSANKMVDVVLESVLHRFGHLALRPSEMMHAQRQVAPCTVYIVKRLLYSLGASLSPHSLSDFLEHPHAFHFCDLDLIDIQPRVRHNMPIMAFADAVVSSVRAHKLAEDTFVATIKADAPVLYYKMDERKGAREGKNSGSAGKDYAALYTRECELWLPGPLQSDPFSRSVAFDPETKSHVDVRFDPCNVPQTFEEHYTIELFANCSGGSDTVRVLYTSGRYGAMVSRDGWLSVTVSDGLCDVSVRVCPFSVNQWQHIMAIFDGTTIRVYRDGKLEVETEVEEAMIERKEVFEKKIRSKLDQTKKKEDEEKAKIKETTSKQADAYFNSKKGIAMLKNDTQEVMESADFQALGIGDDLDNELMAMKERRTAALKQVKANYITELYVNNVKATKEKYAKIYDELNDRVAKRREEGSIKMRSPLRIGASADGEHGWIGQISNFAYYNKTLPFDRVRQHHLLSIKSGVKDAQRLHAMASIKYEEALMLAPDDQLILTGFAESLVEYLKNDDGGTAGAGMSKGKLKILEAIDRFKSIGVPAGIAAILKNIPMESQYAMLVCKAFNAIKFLDRMYFVRGSLMARKDLVNYPHGFALDYPGNSQEYIDTAAAIYCEVIRDSSLSFVYGETDLNWVTELECPELIVAIVRQAREDRSIKVMRVGELYRSVGRETINVTDHDVSVLTAFASLTIGFDFSGCHLLTNKSLQCLGRTANTRIINLENCPVIDDTGILYLLDIAEKLEVINIAGAVHVTDLALAQLFAKCERLTSVNVCNCIHVSFEVLHVLAINNHRLADLRAAACQIDDGGLSMICSALSDTHMRSLDISFCRDVSDYGAISIAESCPALRYLNMSGLSRVSDRGARHVLGKCWYLEELNVEDVFLLSDTAFFFDRDFDGRVAADENMLKHLVTLSLRDCVNVTDQGIKGLAMRCRKVETFVMRGCDKLTDLSLRWMSNPFEDNFPMLDSIRILDISNCALLTAEAVLDILPICGVLEDLRVAGMPGVNDDFVHQMCLKCSTVQRINLTKCIFITDAALCSMADYLWLEGLDISGCRRVSDEGLEVLAVACNGLIDLGLKGVHKITARTVNALARCLKNMQSLDLRDCHMVHESAVANLKEKLPHLNLK